MNNDSLLSSSSIISILENIPDIKKHPLNYVFEDLALKHKPNTLWLEFGVFSGNSINYISNFTKENVYGFDSFEGLPEKWRDGFDVGFFNTNGVLPLVNNNVVLVKGLFQDTLTGFLESHKDEKVGFIHIDCDLYSSTKYVLDTLYNHLDDSCVIVFDELVNYPGFDSETGELLAFYEFLEEHSYTIKYEWIGMNGVPIGMSGYNHENVAVIIYKKDA